MQTPERSVRLLLFQRSRIDSETPQSDTERPLIRRDQRAPHFASRAAGRPVSLSTTPVPLRKARDSPEPPEQNRKAALGIRMPKSANETGVPGQFELR